MEQPPEKRCDERLSCRTPVEWGYFNKSEKYSARMLNYSHTGACFESPHALINGATILVRLEAYRGECGSECRQGCGVRMAANAQPGRSQMVPESSGHRRPAVRGGGEVSSGLSISGVLAPNVNNAYPQ